ncbi:MAG: YD repeat-containing protein [Bacteroidetes bacterium OLB12]|nr:MAG: YD repeat-containing protein [Bacteroidetes bacterium OLB12]
MLLKMSKLFFLSSAIFNFSLAQSDFVNIVPPSPNASAMQQYGNTNIGLYTGAVNVSIPIHTISLKDLQFPIALNYVGSGGINVQSVASWVGLGWVLGCNGAVSRTIYGLADDKPNYGYLYQPGIPPVTSENYNTFLDFANGMTDAEPDKFFFSVAGLSGSFYINKQREIIQVPLTNNKIIPEFSQIGKIVAFKIISDKGIVYSFAEQEELRSYTPGGTSTDNNYYTSSWYLTSVHNYNNTESIDFHYEAYQYYQYAEVYSTRILDNPGTLFLPRYSVTETNAKRLKLITYNNSDSIKFISGNIPRRDLTGEKYLASIKIKEIELAKSVDFAYSYFDANGVSPITSSATVTNSYLQGYLIHAQADGDHFKRLKLDIVSVFNADITKSQAYVFEYFNNVNLPSRFSYARDHWGYYNGITNNPSLEPRRKIDRRPILSQLRGTDFEIVGDANREPSLDHTKAAVLKRIVYPTGGISEFEYELHESSITTLPNQRQSFNISLNPNVLKDTIQLVTINDPFVDVTVNIMGVSLSEYCDFLVNFKNLQNGIVKTLGDFSDSAGSRTIYLEEGDYEISFSESDGIGTCFENFYSLSFQWSNELVTPNKKVGGLRVKKATDISNAGDTITRVYNYVFEGSGLSSGSIGSLPRYGYYEYANYKNGEVELIAPTFAISGYIRTYNTNMPLVMTHGSHVGYKRVEVTTETPTETGKSVYFYSCPSDFPDLMRGFEITLNNGLKEYSYLYPHIDSRDWKRGLLYAQVDYKYLTGQFVPIRIHENHYRILGEVDAGYDFEWQNLYPAEFVQPSYEFATIKFFEEDAANGQGIPKIPGVRSHCMPAPGEAAVCGRLYLANFDFYSGRIQLLEQVQKLYSDAVMLTTGTKFTYSNSNYFYPTTIKNSTSRGDSITSTIRYPFDQLSITGLSSNEKAALDSLVSVNAVAEPVEKIISRGVTELERQRTNFSFSGSKIWRDNIVSSTRGGTLEQVFDFVSYDADGNLLEYLGRDGVPVTIKYGYNNRLPIAKVINSRHHEVFYESFEEAGILGVSKTGKRYHAGDYTLNLTTASPNSILSYWYWQNSQWVFKQVTYSGGSYTITDGDRIDEVRIHPIGAMMTTYTFFPGVGISSTSDQTGMMIGYEYDSFGRLIIVRDGSGNIARFSTYNILGEQ